MISVSHSVAGWPIEAGHSLRLTNVQYFPHSEVALVGIPEYTSLYDDEVNTAAMEVYTTTIPGHDVTEAADPIPDPTGISYTVEDIWQENARTPRVYFSFTLPDYARGVNAWYSPDGITWGQLGSGYTTGFYHLATYYATHYYRLCTVMADGRTMALADADNQIVTIAGPAGGQDIVAGEDLLAGDFVNVYVSGGSMWARKADKSSIDTKADGFVDMAYAFGAVVAVRGPTQLNVNCDGLIEGSTYFLGSNGLPSIAPPVLDGEVNQILGVASAANVIFFSPGPPVVIHTYA